MTDLAAAHVRALRALEGDSPSATYNLGNGEPHSVGEVIKTVEAVTGKAVPHSVGPRRPGDPAELYASNARVKEALGWSPRFADLATIVDTAWRWHLAHPQGYAGAPR